MLNLDVETNPYGLANAVARAWSDDDVMELIERLDAATDDWSFTKRIHDWARSERRNYVAEYGKAAWNDLA